mmetsp:Transcript_32181/g.81019  ORF Transcript_32181/g.81019 Transcript_32181/m.81019 type:complete len:287 (+) Transcript_32181:1648-2508(+)
MPQGGSRSPPCRHSPSLPSRSSPWGRPRSCSRRRSPSRTYPRRTRSPTRSCCPPGRCSWRGTTWPARPRPSRTCRWGTPCTPPATRTPQPRTTPCSPTPRPTPARSPAPPRTAYARWCRGSRSRGRIRRSPCCHPWGRSPWSTCSRRRSGSVRRRWRPRGNSSLRCRPGSKCLRGTLCRGCRGSRRSRGGRRSRSPRPRRRGRERPRGKPASRSPPGSTTPPRTSSTSPRPHHSTPPGTCTRRGPRRPRPRWTRGGTPAWSWRPCSSCPRGSPCSFRTTQRCLGGT